MSSIFAPSLQASPWLATRFVPSEREPAFSAETKRIAERIDSLRIPSSPASSIRIPGEEEDLPERAFEALAAAKILVSQVAMHLERARRDKLFHHLDVLHDTSEWEEGDRPVAPSSFATFLKVILGLRPRVWPGLGLSHNGNVIAAWTVGRDRLTIEFLPHDYVRWVLTLHVGDDVQRFAGQVPVGALAESLAAYKPGRWLSNEGR